MAACDIALELLETILHSVLYLRKLYPEAIFRKRQKYRIPVHMSVHKGVNEYVSASLRALRPYLERRLLESVSVVVTDPAGRHSETLAVELRVLDAAAICARDDPCLARLEASLSGLLLGLSATLGDCDPPPAGSTFHLQAAASRCLPESLHAVAEFPLTITDSAAPHGPTAAAEDGPGTEGCSVLPVRSVRNELFALEVTLRRPTG